jgi:hypothetical protein
VIKKNEEAEEGRKERRRRRKRRYLNQCVHVSLRIFNSVTK